MYSIERAFPCLPLLFCTKQRILLSSCTIQKVGEFLRKQTSHEDSTRWCHTTGFFFPRYLSRRNVQPPWLQVPISSTKNLWPRSSTIFRPATPALEVSRRAPGDESPPNLPRCDFYSDSNATKCSQRAPLCLRAVTLKLLEYLMLAGLTCRPGTMPTESGVTSNKHLVECRSRRSERLTHNSV